jgi:hypothetical protein
MRSILSLSFVFAAACSDYELNRIVESSDEPVTPSEPIEDTDSEEPEVTEEEDAPEDQESSNCFGYEIEVVGSDYLEPGWWCLPARPYFNLIGEEVIESKADVQEMTWVIEIDASPEADIDMDVIVLDFDAVFSDVDWFEELNESENWRWSAITDTDEELAVGPVLASDNWLALVIMEPNADWDPAVVVPQGGSRQIEITLDTSGMAFAPGDSMTASFDNYQTWETGDGVVRRICTSHEEFPLIGTTYEIE